MLKLHHVINTSLYDVPGTLQEVFYVVHSKAWLIIIIFFVVLRVTLMQTLSLYHLIAFILLLIGSFV